MELVWLSGVAVLYKEFAVASAHAVVLILLLLSCAGKVAFLCTSGIWLTIDTLSARATGSDDPWSIAIRSSAAWMTVSGGSVPFVMHCCNWEARIRASGAMAAGS